MERSTTQLDVLISRILIAKPNATPQDIRSLVPETWSIDHQSLGQKLDFPKRRAEAKAPAR